MDKVLFYRWGSVCEPAFGRVLARRKTEYLENTRKLQNYHADASFAAEMMTQIRQNGIDAVFSFDYFPMISMVCQVVGIPYISWIYDCPQYTLYSETVTNACNHIYCFDRILTERIKSLGALNCFHLPLGAELRKGMPNVRAGQYEVSFVGNLYGGEKNRLRKAVFCEKTKGFLEALIRAQLQVYGGNVIAGCLDEALVSEIEQACKLDLGQGYYKDRRQLAADAVSMEVSAREREQMLLAATQHCRVDLFTSAYSKQEFEESERRLGLQGNFDNLAVHPAVDYEKEMPRIFASSKINLNITSKTIESGIPLRVFDILACGGFCLTNYQPELEEWFEAEKDLAVYTDKEDMLDKIRYYLTHEEERNRIAGKGRETLQKTALLEDRAERMTM